MAIEMKVVTITPETAIKYLKHNVDNYRRISKSKVAIYAQEMKAGKWQLNGEAIMFDETGRLKNGQHRLAAIVQAGVPVEMAVISGVADDVTIYDVGSNRSTVQIANASGCGEVTKLEAAAATAIVGCFGQVSKGVVIQWLQGHADEMRRMTRLCGGTGGSGLSCRMSCTLASYLMTRMEKIPAYEIELFFKIFRSGNTVGSDGYEPSPALVARRMFEERYRGNSGTRVTMREQTEVIVLALADFHKSKKRQQNYQLKEPFQCVTMIRRIREQDGLQ